MGEQNEQVLGTPDVRRERPRLCDRVAAFALHSRLNKNWRACVCSSHRTDPWMTPCPAKETSRWEEEGAGAVAPLHARLVLL